MIPEQIGDISKMAYLYQVQRKYMMPEAKDFIPSCILKRPPSTKFENCRYSNLNAKLKDAPYTVVCNAETQDWDFSAFPLGTCYEETPTSATNETRHALIQFYSTVATAPPSKWINLTNMTSNKADAIPEELKSCVLKTIEQRYSANE
ncbi:hypothetical protein TNCV_354631 [Trichonephila clavipes]|uniref:Uncharacterized protein n=1 Tax=Trichonephila clavipes TaxID=2585209 RepID=A0A8X7BD75_TRICX|nr:hypothetical protein TNCV_354631 [Trichonephila clavipes]